MKLSIVIPAYNEEKLLPRCLDSIARAVSICRAGSVLGEVIVVDNNSTDATADLARAAGARVVFEAINQISRARNAGGRAATGDWLLFVDADSRLSAACLDDVLAATADPTCAGGGCVIGFHDCPAAAHPVVAAWNGISRLMTWAAGSFVFCRAEAFRDLGGFPEEVYAAEEILFSQALKGWARARDMRVRILARHRHLSSPRKLHLYSPWEVASLLIRGLCFPLATIRRKEGLGYFYDGRR